ncbi:hemin ABC transporter substrate-binding protein [Shewanella sp. KT0246]|uniref:heme/hemin ABC transporter substrate-binding protein n=1 Tax=Shewanella sp. KT0246 TaxID=2815912 RepID=UPI001BC66AE1|nr:ABC transporter substrate-binding protein [Shewanella sp. KT0246]GIU49444.1 hemin ABC transporter substrate-binding protein [Shewanella sp. KT0246]
MLKLQNFKLNNVSLTSMMTATMLLSAALFSQMATAENRVVSAGAGITELVLALDASDELVGVDSTSLIPDELDAVAKLGYHRMLSAEGILALSPSILLGSEAMGPKNTLDILSNANVEVVTFPSANTKDELVNNVEQMGKLLNRESQANELKQKLDLSFNQLETKQQKISQHGDAPKVLFLLLQQDRPARVGGNNTAADIIINLAGGQNIAGFDGYKSVSQEGILALQPDVILISNRSEVDSTDPVSELLKAMPLLEHTPAGEHKHIKSLPSQALIGGLGLSAVAAADDLASDFISIKKL